MARSAWVLDEGKFLSTAEAQRLLQVTRRRAAGSSAAGDATAVREFLIVHLALCTGLRVGEVAGLRCGDILLERGKSSLGVGGVRSGRA